MTARNSEESPFSRKNIVLEPVLQHLPIAYKDIMDPVYKARKLSVGTDIKQQDYCVDRISNLPTELIGKILSLLPTKQAVATSVLSSSWKWFWTFITRLSLDVESNLDILKPSFISFVYRVMLHRKPAALDYLSVRCYKVDNISHFREWVSAALLVDVKELHLSFDWVYASHVLPADLFSCKNLVKLVLKGEFTVNIPAMVCLPNLQVLSLCEVGILDDSFKRLILGCPALQELKVSNYDYDTPIALPQELFSCRKLSKLELLIYCLLMNLPTLVSLPSLQAIHLRRVEFLDDNSIKRFLSGCPSLQELNMTIENFNVLHIDSSTLSDLIIGDMESEDVSHRKMVLQTPSLRYLKIDGLSADSCEFSDLNQLVEADVDGIHFDGQAMNNLLSSISNVQRLHLCGYTMEDIVKSGCELPKFHNLTTLKLCLTDDIGWALLPDLLEKSPFLETLVFVDGVREDDCSENATWRTPQKVPYCLLHHLKLIQIDYFDGDIEGVEMIQYFIENRGALKDLTIQYSSGSGELWDINVAEG